MLIESISVSRTKLWEECEQKYKYKYHLKIPSPEPTPVYFDYGKVVHKIIETHTLGRGKVEINSIIKSVINGEIELEPGKTCPSLPVEYKNKLPGHIQAYMRLAEKIGTDGMVEWQFKIDMDPPHNRFMLGFIDRIIQKGDEFFILDWKTTKKGPWRETKDTIKESLQLQTYCRVIQKEFKADPKKIRAALYFLEGGELVGATYSEKTLDAVEAKLVEAHKAISNKDPDHAQGNVGWHCKRCEYRKMCPFYSLT
jgi:CRISPR/Cas system-associated exonuclease Cas4 (RecB family)